MDLDPEVSSTGINQHENNGHSISIYSENNHNKDIDYCENISNYKGVQTIKSNSDHSVSSCDEDDSVKDPDYSDISEYSDSCSDHSISTSNNQTRGPDISDIFLDFPNVDDNAKSDKDISNISEIFETSDDKKLSDIPNLSSEVFVDNIPTSSQIKSKQYFCIYCQKLITKFARHLQDVHKEERKVREFMILPKGKGFILVKLSVYISITL